MTTTEAGISRREILATLTVFFAGCSSEEPVGDDGATTTPSPGGGAMQTPTATPSLDGWSVHFAYDGDWQGSVTVTTADGDTHQTFDGEGTTTVTLESQLGVDTEAVQEIVVTAQKISRDNEPLRVAIRKDGDVVAESSTDATQGQLMVSHHEESAAGTETTATATDSETTTDTATPGDTETPRDTVTQDSRGWSAHFAYDGDWQGSVTVTTADGDTHQAFDGEGTTTVNLETQLDVDTEAVQEIVVTAQKMARDNESLRVAIRKDGDVVAESTTDEPLGQVMVSHHAT